jgi:hypothetical protein
VRRLRRTSPFLPERTDFDMKRFRSLLALLAIASIAACGDLPLDPKSSDSDTEQTQRGMMGSGE